MASHRIKQWRSRIKTGGVALSLTAVSLSIALAAQRSAAAGNNDAADSSPSSLPSSVPTSLPISPSAPQPLQMIAHSSRATRTQAAIDRGVKYLLSNQLGNGSWNDTSNGDWVVGQTAIVTLALLSAGQSDQSPELTKAINFLRKGDIGRGDQTYAVALRACVLAQLPEPTKQQELRQDVAWLQKAMVNGDPDDGLFTYGMTESSDTADFSNSQYGVLGCWYAAEAGLEIPFRFWRRAEDGWKKGQQRDGGWGYDPSGGGVSYASMTAAGAATLFITNDYLHAKDAYDLYRVSNDSSLNRAVRWLGEHFAVDHNAMIDPPQAQSGDLLSAFASGPRPFAGTNLPYMLFGYERVGEASGLTRFGSHRWFDEGADFLVQAQTADGSWPTTGGQSQSPEVESAYALLFLSRGLSPVAIQKLQFGKRWNNRPRDVADFVFYLRHNTETHFNWQITSLSASPDEIREAPILYAASDRPIALGDAEAAALKDYLLHGGLFVAANDGENDAFARSVEVLARELFPAYPFTDLPLSDPAYMGNFPTTGVRQPIRVLSNGVRKLMVLYPRGDLSWRFTVTGGSPVVRQSPYNTLANIWAQMAGRQDPLLKGESMWVERSSATPDASVNLRLARLQYAGNWDPEPAGWVRLANLLHNAGDAELQTEAISFDKLTSSYPIAHLTGTGTIRLTAAEQAALRNYLDHGGLLLFDAAGGSAEAADSIQAILAGMYPNSRNEPLPIDHPIYAGTYPGGRTLNSLSYRPSSLPPTNLPRLRGISAGGKLLAIVSDEDLSGGLVGYPYSGFAGYSAGSAAELVRAILLWRK